MPAYMARPNRNISFDKRSGTWKVKIIRAGEEHYLGRHATIEAAREARDAFEDPRREALIKRAEMVDDPLLTVHRTVTVQWRAFLADPEYLGLLAQLDELTANKQRQMIESGLPADIVYAITAH